MISMLLGDGSINKDNGFRMTHCEKQKSYLEWKIKQLNAYGIKNCGIKSYVSTKGYKVGETYYYTRLSVVPFIKVLKRVVYKPNKVIANRKLLNRLDAKGLAIWYMDDGHINHRKVDGKPVGIYVKIATCLSKFDNQIIIDYFKDVWNIHFYMFSEGKRTYSLCCGTDQAVKFLDIVKPFCLEAGMEYKVLYDLGGRKLPVGSSEPKQKTPIIGEDMVYSSLKDEAVNNGAEVAIPYE